MSGKHIQLWYEPDGRAALRDANGLFPNCDSVPPKKRIGTDPGRSRNGDTVEELPESTRNQIRLEELYRFDIRDQIQQKEREKHARSFGLLAFVNSSFGLWLLSAVFITGAGSAYTHWRSVQEEQQKREAQLRADAQNMKELSARLRLEIGHRISQTLVLLWDLSDRRNLGRLGTGHNTSEVRSVLDTFQNGNAQKLASLYPEFANQNTLGLLTELRRLDNQDKEKLDRAVADLSGLDVLLDNEKASMSNPESVASAILKRFSSILWGDFYFLDCAPEMPFC
jgi:hypothetical protein